ncbi:MAG: BspA family leucine-rich repeat surface protein, partial [Flavobacteriales bacterium]
DCATGNLPLEGLIAYYPFNGNANDESGNGHNGTVNGATLSVDRNGYDNSAYDFQVANWDSGNNGGGDYIYIPHSNEFNFESFTLSAWVYRTSDGASNSPQHLTILRKFEEGYNNPNGESWQFDIAHGTNNGGAILKGTIIEQSPSPAINFNCATAQTINENEWTNVIMTYTDKTIKTFINGVESCSSTNNNITLNTLGTSGISIGMSVQANGRWGPFDGSIDEVGIWNRTLTQQEINNLYLGSAANTTPITDANIHTAVDLWVSDPSAATTTYGNISTWDVSQVTNMSELFNNKTTFNDDISNWDVSSVANMRGMFAYASAFNQDIGAWNVSKVINMGVMFFDATSFNQPIGGWDVSNVNEMGQMFHTSGFNQDIGVWDVSNVTNMAGMFKENNSFNQNIGSWDVSSVTGMRSIFRSTINFNQDLSSWDVSSATNMELMFFKTALSTENYDNILIGWAALEGKKEDVILDATNNYCLGATARATMEELLNWTFNDAGLDCATGNLPLEGLIAYYPFNGNANDESGNEHNGTVNGAVLTSDRFGNANNGYKFDGVDDFITTEAVLGVGQVNLTFSFWANSDVSDVEMSALSQNCGDDCYNAYNLIFNKFLNSANVCEFGHMGTSPLSFAYSQPAHYGSVNFQNQNNWNHYVLVIGDNEDFSYANFKFYINGNEVQTDCDHNWGGWQVDFPSYPLLIGKKGPAGFFNGKIDDIAIWNRSLSANEILNLNSIGNLSTNKINTVSRFSVYPNPVHQDLKIVLAAESNFIKCEVYNLLGQVVLESKQTKFSVNKLPAATYFIKVFTENGQAVNRFIKK